MPFYTVELLVRVVVHDDAPDRALEQARIHGEKILRLSSMQGLLKVISSHNPKEMK
jgi:hypothetical protein